jgi:hypothetical protein
MPWVDPNTHGWVLHPREDADWDALVHEYGGDFPDPLQQVFRVARDGGCSTVVVENRYVDLDFRSEYSAFWSLRFESPPPFARRLHFFKAELQDEQIHAVDGKDGYLGYSILRPLGSGAVGRTVLQPPPALASATLATVEEQVSLYGNRLWVRGVPFVQQDCEYLRCAHAAAWICHYTAYLRGLVGRQTTASIVDHTPSLLSAHRALPSKGMNLNQLQAVFGSVGQPALFYGLSNMPRVRGVKDPKPAVDKDGKARAAGYWDTRIFSVICRYLNSGFPVLIAGQDHAFALVGWFRDGDKIRFVACDDQKGPYEIIDSPFTHYKAPWHSIMVPLPPKVFLTGESAENAAYELILTYGLNVAGLQPLADGLRAGTLRLRSSLKDVRAFKDEVQTQTTSDDVLRAVRLARLPHFVWTVEAHDTSQCDQGPCVYAAALYDSTSSDLSATLNILSLPAVVGIYPPDHGVPVVVTGGSAPWQSMLTAH